MSLRFNFIAPDRIGPLWLGQALSAIPRTFAVSALDGTDSDRIAKVIPYSVIREGSEVAEVDARLGLIVGITTYASFYCNGVEAIGSTLDETLQALEDRVQSHEDFLHADGEEIAYLSLVRHRVILSVAEGRVSSVSIF